MQAIGKLERRSLLSGRGVEAVEADFDERLQTQESARVRYRISGNIP
jgi:hypothetical protein